MAVWSGDREGEGWTRPPGGTVVVEGGLHEPKIRPHFDGTPFVVIGAHNCKTVL